MEPEARLAEVQRDIVGLASLARAVNMAMAIPNVAGENIGAAIWDTNMIIRGMDPRTVGYAFDRAMPLRKAASAVATSRCGWPARLKMVTVRDFTWTKERAPGSRSRVLWARAWWTGRSSSRLWPAEVSPDRSPCQMDYQPQDELGAIRRDVAFVRKQISAAYGAA